MRSILTDTQNKLAARRLVARDFFWIIAKDGSNSPITAGYWNDRNQITAIVNSGQDGTDTSRTYNGTGRLIVADDIPLTNDLSIRTINVSLTTLNAAIDTLIRGYNLRLAPVEIHRLLFDPVTRILSADVQKPRFIGFVDSVTVNTPQVGQTGSVQLKCVSHTQELTRTSSDKRSNSAQHRRLATDDFYQYAGVMPDRTVFWGQEHGVTLGVANIPAPRQGIDALKRFF